MTELIIDEIRDDVWHLLLHVHVHQDKSERYLAGVDDRFALWAEMIAMNSLANEITVRMARLVDPTKGVRSVKNLEKTPNPNSTSSFRPLLKELREAAKPVLKIRNGQLAHMKAGTTTSYPMVPLAPAVQHAISLMVQVFDAYEGREMQYHYRVGSQEPVLDLRKSAQTGTRAYVE